MPFRLREQGHAKADQMQSRFPVEDDVIWQDFTFVNNYE